MYFFWEGILAIKFKMCMWCNDIYFSFPQNLRWKCKQGELQNVEDWRSIHIVFVTRFVMIT